MFHVKVGGDAKNGWGNPDLDALENAKKNKKKF